MLIYWIIGRLMVDFDFNSIDWVCLFIYLILVIEYVELINKDWVC